MGKNITEMTRKIFLISMIVLFIGAGLVSATFFLVGELNETALRIIGTIGALFVYSLMGLASSKILERKSPLRYLSLVGLFFATVSLALVLPVIWNLLDTSDSTWKAIAISSIVSFAIAHISLLSGRMKHVATKIAFFITLGLIVVVAGLLIYMVVADLRNSDAAFWRFLGFFAILDVAGTIVTPLMRKLKG